MFEGVVSPAVTIVTLDHQISFSPSVPTTDQLAQRHAYFQAS